VGVFTAAVTASYGDFDAISNIGFLILGGLFFVAFIILILYIDCFLDNFVVPIMYKNRIGALEGWSKFLKLFGRNAGHFFLFGIIKAILNVFIVMGVILIGVFTCCLGFLVLIIPYIGDVVLLPLSYTFRGFGVEFLEQFGDEFKLFPSPDSEISSDTDFPST
jgi:hypothetical protein